MGSADTRAVSRAVVSCGPAPKAGKHPSGTVPEEQRQVIECHVVRAVVVSIAVRRCGDSLQRGLLLMVLHSCRQPTFTEHLRHLDEHCPLPLTCEKSNPLP